MSYTPNSPENQISFNHKNSAFSESHSSHSPRVERIKKSTRAKTKNNDMAAENFPIIVHCHLCWDWVWQRPQQFLSRLSRRHPILFVETIGPDPNLVAPHVRLMEKSAEHPNITRLRLQFPSWRWTDEAYVDRARRELVQDALRGPLAGQFQNAVQWFYDPMAVTAFAGHMGEIATVYDCMDELSKFSEAHPELTRREAELLARADVVFTGGRKLFEAKRQHNSNCHFYGCGVDFEHFGRAREERTIAPHDIKDLPKPVLGFFGVVDERMDYELIGKLADANPQWSIVMIGPVLKVRQDVFPRRPNLHWPGARDYGQLPLYCKAFDICLMPFALNEATEYINPTKALEYMATGRPVVSTAVADVVSNFGSVVKIAFSHDHFITLCREAIEQPDRSAIERGLKLAGSNTWDCIVAKLERHIVDALSAKRRSRGSKNQKSAEVQRSSTKILPTTILSNGHSRKTSSIKTSRRTRRVKTEVA